MRDSHTNAEERKSMTISWRLKPAYWHEDEQFDEVLQAFDKHPMIADEISFFIGDMTTWHGYTPLDEIDRQMALARRRFEQVRSIGVATVGFNVWPSFGNEGSPCRYHESMPQLPYPNRVDRDGHVFHKCACPNSADFLEHTRAVYRLAAAAHPDFIWIDDDFTGPLKTQCFCDACVAGFEGSEWQSRETLVEALDQAENEELRRAWLDYSRRFLRGYCAMVRGATDETDPNIDLGLMTVGPGVGTHGGDYIADCMRILRSHRGRPGHGFYKDHTPRDLTGKILEAAWQIQHYPDGTDDIQYEYEDWPCTPMDKSVSTSIHEITLALAAGCSGVAMSTFHFTGSGVADQDPLMATMAAKQKEWDAYRNAANGLTLAGLHPGVAVERQRELALVTDTARCNPGDFREWAHFGVPFTFDPAFAVGAILGAEAASGLPADELESIFAGPVFMDVDALRELQKRKLHNWTGCKAGDYLPGSSERFTEHRLNGEFTGQVRTMFWYGGNAIQPIAADVELLSRLSYPWQDEAEPCMTAYENELGGRVVIMGYEPWTAFGLRNKWTQLQTVMAWATDGRMPLSIDRMLRVTPFLRVNEKNDRFALTLMNNGLDDTGEFTIAVRTGAASVRTLPKEDTLPATKEDDMVRLRIANLPAWSTLNLIGD